MEKEINYKIIREIQRAEKESSSLTKLDKDFAVLVQAYLYDLEQRRVKAKSEKTMFSEELTEQLESEFINADKIITDLFERRERKIVLKALTNIRTGSDLGAADNLLPSETIFYKKIKSQLKSNRDQFLKELLTPLKRKDEEQKVLKTIKVRILEEIPSFVWDDEKTYGPFKKDGEARLPADIAEFLVDNNKAVKNETAEESEEVLPALQDARGAQSGKSQD